MIWHLKKKLKWKSDRVSTLHITTWYEYNQKIFFKENSMNLSSEETNISNY